ncbi:MAG: exosortase-associated EpsI family protein [Phycisphaerae bacterium]|nr:exosortase-associated EpsI family protein [Phycisphaerae bacterium]
MNRLSIDPPRGIIQGLLKDRGFLAGAIVLAAAAVSVHAAAERLQLHFRKLPIPLRKSLAEFDATKMGSYKFVQRVELKPEMEAELGTQDYVQLIFEDTSIGDEQAPGRYVHFFVTYYTGDPDQVPHVPDVCYVGAGHQTKNTENFEMIVPGIGADEDRLPVRLLVLERTDTFAVLQRPVLYFFAVNGGYACERTAVRLRLADLRTKYAYFSKVELAFSGAKQPTAEQAKELAQKFYAQAVPILVDEHWPDWEQATDRR